MSTTHTECHGGPLRTFGQLSPRELTKSPCNPPGSNPILQYPACGVSRRRASFIPVTFSIKPLIFLKFQIFRIQDFRSGQPALHTVASTFSTYIFEFSRRLHFIQPASFRVFPHISRIKLKRPATLSGQNSKCVDFTFMSACNLTSSLSLLIFPPDAPPIRTSHFVLGPRFVLLLTQTSTS